MSTIATRLARALRRYLRTTPAPRPDPDHQREWQAYIEKRLDNIEARTSSNTRLLILAIVAAITDIISNTIR